MNSPRGSRKRIKSVRKERAVPASPQREARTSDTVPGTFPFVLASRCGLARGHFFRAPLGAGRRRVGARLRVGCGHGILLLLLLLLLLLFLILIFLLILPLLRYF